MKIEPLAMAPVSVAGSKTSASNAPEESSSFADFLGKALGEVNQLQLDSKDATMKLATGQVEDVAEVMIASEKAAIALQMTMQVRNKVVEAYQEVMRMPV